ncbi:MAG: hypothetical protein HPY45_14670 [Anaerolineae bacterium]|nr:hypothetical protein [Anaerolineae bacterium]
MSSFTLPALPVFQRFGLGLRAGRLARAKKGYLTAAGACRTITIHLALLRQPGERPPAAQKPWGAFLLGVCAYPLH